MACACAALGNFYWKERSHAALLDRLAKYGEVTVQWEYLPLPHVYQLSVGTGVTNDDLREIVSMPEFKDVTRLYLKSHDLTDASLRDVHLFNSLEHVLIDSDNITDDTIIDFEARHPACRVIAYGRDLNEGIDVTLGPP
jgi:hypothetical protein